MSTLNDSISSDELQVTFDNTGGIFDFLNFSNMNQIIAPKTIYSTGIRFGNTNNTSDMEFYTKFKME
jgi:hypothetical protein